MYTLSFLVFLLFHFDFRDNGGTHGKKLYTGRDKTNYALLAVYDKSYTGWILEISHSELDFRILCKLFCFQVSYKRVS